MFEDENENEDEGGRMRPRRSFDRKITGFKRGLRLNFNPRLLKNDIKRLVH